MAIIKDFKTIVNSLKTFLHSVRPNVDTSPGSYTRDVVIDAPANELDVMYTELKRTSDAQSPDSAAPGDAESLGRNFFVLRKGPLPASSISTFYSFEEPASDIPIPRGTQLATKASVDSTSRLFVTTQASVLTATHFNAETGRYEVSVPVRATVGGTSSNVGAGALSSIMNPINGIDGVFNFEPITNGTDFEPLAIFRNRLKTVITGNNAGTATGYYQTVTRIAEVLDAKVAAVNTGPEALRRPDPGAVDIYIRGIVSAQAPVESFIVKNSPPFNYFLNKQPVDVNSLDSIVVIGSIAGTMVQDTDYTFSQDTSTFGGSIRGADKLIFQTGTLEEQISIWYSYNSLVESLQIYMNSDSRKVLGADLLINGAFARLINIECTIRLLSGFTSSTVSASVVENLQTTLNSYQIGEEVQQSDIIAVITGTSGVDDVTVPLDLFEESSDTGDIEQDASGNLVIPVNSYAVTGDTTVNIRV